MIFPMMKSSGSNSRLPADYLTTLVLVLGLLEELPRTETVILDFLLVNGERLVREVVGDDELAA